MSRVPGTVSSAAPPNAQSRPPSPRLAVVASITVWTSFGECESLGHVAGRIDDDVVTDHHPGQVRRLIHNAASHAQVWRARELGLVSHHRGDLVSARKRCSENALAGVAGGAEEKDFHNRTSRNAVLEPSTNCLTGARPPRSLLMFSVSKMHVAPDLALVTRCAH